MRRFGRIPVVALAATALASQACGTAPLAVPKLPEARLRRAPAAPPEGTVAPPGGESTPTDRPPTTLARRQRNVARYQQARAEARERTYQERRAYQEDVASRSSFSRSLTTMILGLPVIGAGFTVMFLTVDSFSFERDDDPFLNLAFWGGATVATIGVLQVWHGASIGGDSDVTTPDSLVGWRPVDGGNIDATRYTGLDWNRHLDGAGNVLIGVGVAGGAAGLVGMAVAEEDRTERGGREGLRIAELVGFAGVGLIAAGATSKLVAAASPRSDIDWGNGPSATDVALATTLVGGLAVLGTGIALSGSGAATTARIDGDCIDGICREAAETDFDHARSLSETGGWLMVGGGAATAAAALGIVLQGKPVPGVAVRPILGPGAVGVRGTF